MLGWFDLLNLPCWGKFQEGTPVFNHISLTDKKKNSIKLPLAMLHELVKTPIAPRPSPSDASFANSRSDLASIANLIQLE